MAKMAKKMTKTFSKNPVRENWLTNRSVLTDNNQNKFFYKLEKFPVSFRGESNCCATVNKVAQISKIWYALVCWHIPACQKYHL